MNTLFRRSASIAPTASRQTLAALLRLIPSESFAPSTISQLPHVNGSPPTKKGGAFDIRSRDFHFAAPTRSSGFRASGSTCAEFAMDESFFDDEKSSSSTKKGEDEEGLLIAKLNIDKRIVQELERKGITKLFPIQVTASFLEIWSFLALSLYYVIFIFK